MKRLHTFACTLCILGLLAINGNAQKVVVIKKSTDQHGVVQDVRVSEGEEATELLRETEVTYYAKGERHTSACDSEQKEVILTVNDDDQEQTITIDINGETEVIHLVKGEELSPEVKARLQEKGVTIDAEGGIHSDKIFIVQKDKSPYAFDLNLEGLSKGMHQMTKGLSRMSKDFQNINWNFDMRSGINCAALGVYVSSAKEGGVYVSGIIGASGAQDAGLSRGDVITAIDEMPTDTYSQLHDALGQYEPGDVVAVTYQRAGAEDRVEAQLRAWKEFPSFQERPHARVTCDQDAVAEETVTRKIIVIKKDREEDAEEVIELPQNINQSPLAQNTLTLTDFVAFPNPTDGRFTLQFSGEAQPVVVSVYDGAGREIYRERVSDFNGSYSRELDLTSQARGALVISVEQNGQSWTEQIMVH